MLRSLGAEVVAVGIAPDGRNINLNCGSTATQLMQDTVVAEKADMGIALDGDGDRIIVCDEFGAAFGRRSDTGFFGRISASEWRVKGRYGRGDGLVEPRFGKVS